MNSRGVGGYMDGWVYVCSGDGSGILIWWEERVC